MANKQSALKEIRKTIKRTEHNSRIKTNFKHLFRACTDLIEAGDMVNAKVKAAEFQQTADKAAKRHIISKNRADRKKAALSAMLNGTRIAQITKGKTKSKTPKVEEAPAVTEEIKPEEIQNEV
jgi:ribosomal protein S20